MERLLEKNEFELTTIIPMKLDAYYVSLLSERNKKASFAIQAINGFTMGMISNLSGRKTLNHSSLIYIARPK